MPYKYRPYGSKLLRFDAFRFRDLDLLLKSRCHKERDMGFEEI